MLRGTNCIEREATHHRACKVIVVGIKIREIEGKSQSQGDKSRLLFIDFSCHLGDLPLRAKNLKWAVLAYHFTFTSTIPVLLLFSLFF